MRTLALAVVVLALAPAAPAAERPSAAALESQLVCPTCDTTLDQSNAPVARRMKAYIRERIAAGASERQIKDELVAQFGPGVLAVPEKRGFGLLAWVLPLAGLALAAGVVGYAAWRWSGGLEAEPEPAAPLDPEQERRLDEELARFDA